jgi:phospholipase C
MRIPSPDPGELWSDINTQLFGSPAAPRPGQPPTMDGFVRNYLAQQQLNPTETYDPKNVMHYFTPDQVPVLSRLAKQFAVCDRWFASAPCQTWPNRWFVHAATADRHENNNPLHFPDVPTIFNLLELAGMHNWKIYFHDLAQAHTLLRLFFLGSHFHSYRQFQADCQSNTLPAYSFIEPQYFADFGHPENDQHPPSVVTLGEQLIADVYNCLRASKAWRKTLLIITHDEHGGCYDHVPPPATVPPEPPIANQTFGSIATVCGCPLWSCRPMSRRARSSASQMQCRSTTPRSLRQCANALASARR